MKFANIRWVGIVVLTLVAIACGLWGGGDNQVDVALVRAGVALRGDTDLATTAGLILNVAGGASAMIGLAVGAMLIMWFAGRRRDVMVLAATLIGGRLLIEAIKILVRRARPALDVHPVVTHSLSFPSAHAGSSMIVFGALALAFASPRHRIPALTTAVGASLLVGASRPLLGVHWPSDVIAGWAIGVAWLLLWWPALRLAADEPQHDVVGGHRSPRIEP